MEAVTLYKTKDGKLFDDEEKARSHEAAIDILDSIEEIMGIRTHASGDVESEYIDPDELWRAFRGNIGEIVERIVTHSAVKRKPAKLAKLSKKDPFYKQPIGVLELSERAEFALEAAEIMTVGKLTRTSADSLLKLKNVGLKTIREIRWQLAMYGLCLLGEENILA